MCEMEECLNRCSYEACKSNGDADDESNGNSLERNESVPVLFTLLPLVRRFLFLCAMFIMNSGH